MKRENKIWMWISFIFISVVLLIVSWLLIRTRLNFKIDFDSAWNATVALNFAKTGKYQVSYPEDIVFYNMITTGLPTLFPTAIAYKIFGFNYITTMIVPLIYGNLSVYILWMIYRKALNWTGIKDLFAAILSVLTFFAYYEFSSSRALMGEPGALFSLLIALYMLLRYIEKHSKWYLVVSGCMVELALINKSAMICFFVVSILLVFIESILMKRIRFRNGLYFLLGIIVGAIFTEGFKAWQYGSVWRVLEWWRDEYGNMMSQSSGLDVEFDKLEKLNIVASWIGCTKWVTVLVIFVPLLIYGITFIMKLFFRKELFSKNTMAVIYAGLGGSSLVVYFVLLGGNGLTIYHRIMVNVMIMMVAIIYLWVLCIQKTISWITENRKAKNIKLYLIGILVIACTILLFPAKNIINASSAMLSKAYGGRENRDEEEQFLEKISNLEDEAILYCFGFNQDPNVTLFLNREMASVFDGDLNAQNGYYIIGEVLGTDFVIDIVSAQGKYLVDIDTGERVFGNLTRYKVYKIYPYE